MADEPIEPQDFIGGVKVVDIGDVRVSRGLSRRHHSSCAHRQLHYDRTERRIWCADCEKDIDPFDAFQLLVEQFHAADQGLLSREKKLKEAESWNIRALAAKEMDKVWRSRLHIPACPSCGEGLFPEDFKNGISTVLGREYAEAKRRLKKGAR